MKMNLNDTIQKLKSNKIYEVKYYGCKLNDEDAKMIAQALSHNTSAVIQTLIYIKRR